MRAIVATQHNDNARSGVNAAESDLTWDNVGVATFGKLCTHQVDGHVYAQPLFVPDVAVPDRGVKDLLIVATMANTVHAFDAADETGTKSAELWVQRLGPPVPTRAFKPDYNDIAGAKASTIGIVSTPVVDAVIKSGSPTTGTLYVVAYAFDATAFGSRPEEAFSHLLYALDLATGHLVRRPGLGANPVRFEGTAAGSGYGADNRIGPAQRKGGRIVFSGKIGDKDAIHDKNTRPPRQLDITDGRITAQGDEVVFNSMQQLQRPGLLLADGVLYTGFGSHGDDDPYHGWVFAHEAATFARKGVFCTTRNGAQAGVWQAGEGLGSDGRGHVFAGTGNGDPGSPFAPGMAWGAFGECLLKLRLDAKGIELAGFSQAFQDPQGGDEDFGASSPTFLPDGLMVGGGKDGRFYLFDPDAMDTNGSPAALKQVFLAASDGRSDPAKTHHIHGSPVVLDGASGTLVYVWGEDDYLRCFRYDAAAHTFPGQPNDRAQAGTPLAIGMTLASGDVKPRTPEEPRGGMPGAMLSISANGAAPRSAILWASFPPYEDANQAIVGGELRALKADEFEKGRFVTLWSSRCNRARDDFGNFAKFCCPTIAAGRVYQATFNDPGEVAVYGRLTKTDGGYDVGFGGNAGLTFNGSASIEKGHLRLVGAPHAFQAGSVFHTEPVDVEGFGTSFVVRLTQSEADGFTFTVQGESPHALGGSGMGVGYAPDTLSPFVRGASIGRSVAVKFGLTSPTPGRRSTIALLTDGVVPADGAGESELGVDLHRAASIRVTIAYTGGRLVVLVEDTADIRRRPIHVPGPHDRRTFEIDISRHAGKKAFVGFTGATGTKTSTIDILSWDFGPVVVA